jgi:hypothetical protein
MNNKLKSSLSASTLITVLGLSVCDKNNNIAAKTKTKTKIKIKTKTKTKTIIAPSVTTEKNWLTQSKC